jgi:uncharacterized protein YndB with AHSA1/START domain
MTTQDRMALMGLRDHALDAVRASQKEVRIALAVYTATTLHRQGDRQTLRFVRLLPHDADRVWRAITDCAELAHWIPENVLLERKEILTFDPPRVVELAQRGELLRFALAPQGDRTELIFTHTFDDVTKSARNASHWELCLANLEKRLAGKRSSPHSRSRFSEVFAKYAWEFGPQASAQREYAW